MSYTIDNAKAFYDRQVKYGCLRVVETNLDRVKADIEYICAFRNLKVSWDAIAIDINDKFAITNEAEKVTAKKLSRLVSNMRARGLVDGKLVAQHVEKIIGKKPPKSRTKPKAKPQSLAGTDGVK